LRPEFSVKPLPRAVGRVKRVLVTLGGSDPHGLSFRVARWVLDILGRAQVDLVVGPFGVSPGDAIASRGIAVHEQPADIRRLMLEADIAVSGGGQTLYELAATGTPTVALQVATNQALNIAGLEAAGTLIAAGAADAANLERSLKAALLRLVDNPIQRVAMSRAGRTVVDGLGAMRVARAILDRVSANGAAC
jgi:UDP-2,4-diacetamido-2,4,6-trideoxy-beta-L-altropyranose hydrolase